MHIYIVPRTAGDSPLALALDQSLSLNTPDARRQESLYPVSTASSDYDELLAMLDREIDFYNNGPSGGAEADVRYFDVDDLYFGWRHEEGWRREEEAYDYPRGIDDDDDDLLHVREAERISGEHGGGGALSGKHPPQRDLFAFGAVEEEEEEEITNAQYFDLLELRITPPPLPLPDVLVPSSSSDGEDDSTDSDFDFEIDDDSTTSSLGPHKLTVPVPSDGADPISAKALRRQLGRRGDGVNLYGYGDAALVFRHLDYYYYSAGLDGFEERSSDVLLSSEVDVWMDDEQLC